MGLDLREGYCNYDTISTFYKRGEQKNISTCRTLKRMGYNSKMSRSADDKNRNLRLQCELSHSLKNKIQQKRQHFCKLWFSSFLADWLIARISMCAGGPNKVT